MSALLAILVASTFIDCVSIDWACSVFSLSRLCAIALYVFLYVSLCFFRIFVSSLFSIC